MDISPFIQTAFGTIAGGSIVIATNWLTARAERKKQSQEWWEQKYVSEGIDRLITYLKSVQLYSANMNLAIGSNTPIIAKPQEVPLEALTRTESFLHRDISGIILMAYLSSDSDIFEQRNAAVVAITRLLDVLYQLRDEILRNMPQINSRYHQAKITHEYEKVKTDLSDYLEKLYTELHDEIIAAATEHEENEGTDERVLVEVESGEEDRPLKAG